MNGQGKGSA